ncbi:hypothetical protein L6R53_00785 [Myxococcota bacterium]|nr:hypothetical protein [Myxococcota bacterium]
MGPEEWDRVEALRETPKRTHGEREELQALRARWGLRLQVAMFAWPNLDAVLRRYLVRYALVEVLHQPPGEVWPALAEVFGEGNDHAPVGDEALDPREPGPNEPRAGVAYLPATHDLAFEADAFLLDCGPWGTTVLARPECPLGYLRTAFARGLVDLLRSRYGRAASGPPDPSDTSAAAPEAEPRGAGARKGDWRDGVRPDERSHHETSALLDELWHIQDCADLVPGPDESALASCYDDAIKLIWDRLQANEDANPKAVLATLIRKLLPTHVLPADPARAPHCTPLSDGAQCCATRAWSGSDWKDAWPETAEALAETLERPNRIVPPPPVPTDGLSLLARLLAKDQDHASVVQAGLLARRLPPSVLHGHDRKARERARNAVEAAIRLQHARYAGAVRDHFERSLALVQDRLDLLPEHGP